MEYVDGLDLRQILKAHAEKSLRLRPAEVAAIGETIATALAHAHTLSDETGRALGIVHRDVTPHNIMVGRNGVVRLMDFGIAKAVDRDTRTATGAIKGKVAYMAPEQAAGRELDARSDEFALGLVLWECLTGERMFAGANEMELLRQVVAGQVRPLRPQCPDIPDVFEAIVMRALAPSAADRYPSLAALAQALAEFRFSLGTAGVVDLSGLVAVAAPPVVLLHARHTLPLDAVHPASVATEPDPSAGSLSKGWNLTQLTAVSEPVLGAPTRSVTPVAPREATPVDVPASAVVVDRFGGRHWQVGVGAGVGVALVALLFGGGAQWLRARRPLAPVLPTPIAIAPTAAIVATLAITSLPPGAQLWLQGRDTGLVTPTQLPGRQLGESLTLALRLPGYQEWSGVVTVQAPQDRLQVALVSTTATPVASPARVATPGVVGQGSLHKPRRVQGSSTSANARPATAKLWLRSSGAWVDVYCEGRKLGTTPLNGVEVPSGDVALRLVNTAAHVDRVMNFTFDPDSDNRRTINP